MLPLAAPTGAKDYLNDVKKRMAERREAVAGDGALAGFAGVANLCYIGRDPGCLATAGRLDIARSNCAVRLPDLYRRG